MKYLSLFLLATGISVSSEAKIWRVNNNAGVVADFTSLGTAFGSASVVSGDTVYLEPSATNYTGGTLRKKLTIIGSGYFLDPTHATFPGNPGLQESANESRTSAIMIYPEAAGTKILGITMVGYIHLYNATDLTVERVLFFNQNLRVDDGTCSDIKVRKCFFYSGDLNTLGGTAITGLVCENNIFASGRIDMGGLTGSNNIIRNNSFYNSIGLVVVNAYFANNIVGASQNSTLTNCTIKNNVFQVNQPLPGTATNNKVSQDMTAIYELAGSYDGKFRLKAGSPASAAGLTVGSVTTPDCGAFGATDPYKLSGIANIPTVYTFTAPTSIPSGTPTMNITFSTRNHN